MVVDFVKGAVLGGIVVSAGLAVVSQATLPAAGPAGVRGDLAGVEAPDAENATEQALPTPADGDSTQQASEPGDATDIIQTAPEEQSGSDDTAANGAAISNAADAEDIAPAPMDAPASLAEATAPSDEPLLQPMDAPQAPVASSATPEVAALTDEPSAPIIDPAPADPSELEAKAEIGSAAAPDVGADTTPLPQITSPDADADIPGAVDEDPAASASVETADEAPDGATGTLSTLLPDAGLAEKPVTGVTTGRLPTITSTSPAPEPAASAADLPAFKRFARSFENPSAKPLFAVLLLDSGAQDVPRAELAALPLPISFVLDPMQPGASEAAKIYRDAGQEVVMLATGIPQGATAADLEQSFAGLQDLMPEAVALIDTAEARFQNNRGLSAEVITHLTDRGLGLVTFDRGLNAADQVARREGLPAATVFRTLDAEEENSPLIRRYLDRAAFKAAQEGRVVVIGTAREATITALMEWAVEGRSASVALAPISAVMQAP